MKNKEWQTVGDSSVRPDHAKLMPPRSNVLMFYRRPPKRLEFKAPEKQDSEKSGNN